MTTGLRRRAQRCAIPARRDSPAGRGQTARAVLGEHCQSPPFHNRNCRRRPFSSLIGRRPPLLPLRRGGAGERKPLVGVEGTKNPGVSRGILVENTRFRVEIGPIRRAPSSAFPVFVIWKETDKLG